MHSISLLLRLGFLYELVLNDVPLLQVHTILDGLQLVVDLVELVHEYVGLSLLILPLTLLRRDSIFEPLPLLLEVLDFDLLLEEQNLLLLPQTLYEDPMLGQISVVIRLC